MGENIQLKDRKKYEDFYQKIRKKITKWVREGKLNRNTDEWVGRLSEYLIIFPDIVYLLIKLLFDKEVPVKTKSLIVGVLAYLLSPIDVIPDFIPVAGLVDDLLVAVIVLNKIINSEDPLVNRKISEFWPGESDIFEQVRKILHIVNEFASEIPKGILKFMTDEKGGKK